MGKNWHPQCFKCTACAKQLDPQHFYEKNGLPYCERDYNRLFAPPCAGCKLPITNTVSHEKSIKSKAINIIIKLKLKFV
jgi:paxillin